MPPRSNSSSAAANGPKKRSRTGCHGCKNRKVKCDEAKPRCTNCVKQNEECDYSLKLQWGGRSKKEQNAYSAMSDAASGFSTISFATPSAPPTAAPSPSAQMLPMVELQNTTQETLFRESGSSTNAQAVPSDHNSGYNPGMGASRPSAYPEPTGSYSSLPQFALPNPYPMNPPTTGQYYRSPSLTRPPSPYEFGWSNEDRTKRARLDSGDGPPRSLPPLFARQGLPEPHGSPFSPYDQASPGATAYQSAPSPLTPGPSSAHPSPGLRRLSVNYLLSGPAGDHASPRSSYDRFGGYRRIEDGCTIYGYDHGLPDLDIPRNDDNGAINPQTPAASMASPSTLSDIAWSPSQLFESPVEKPAFEKGGYYARPVPIRIPLELEPLPAQLSESPMNLIYFHHFLNHTARILVPHDCPDNPLKTTLPRIAVRNANLLNLLLAYSASHRARLLSHPEPANRVATWLRDVFPDLRRSLSSNEPVSNATLTTAIMLASRECINPNSLDVSIPWQTHLEIARQIIISRGGLKDQGDTGDSFVNFLARWFAYLDVIGSLSGHRNQAPLDDEYMSFDAGNQSDAYGFTIDCFFGFTNCCISLLARVARLARQCGAQRIDGQGSIDANWTASKEVLQEAEGLKRELSHSRHHVQRGCRHSRDEDEQTSERTRLELQEMVSVNESFHLAGLIHLHRRVFGKASTDPEVQDSVKLVLQALKGVRRGGTAESSLLFPMFTAGCEAQDVEDRDVILERLKLVEGLGMTYG
ncbi:hypothetical protein AUEXF2481DRAFT_34089 [Aureobasidium subglaciale EXF-2481]|uniref:Zn(2)-C6 fungal-type domain-containing protein n=1 Tax=Aureobasidium subglaciale (strain EXF-2481) TaxID=1043005 RepID=A0A074Y7W1_AURSE|nr:uncharacterized protein AUEXF2481DRAFT_34089 [Aureobasidium subglaciale EXF-2481]KEQ90307.1 hypothetical protein AUEXF2481DRAFT_34089 [Aureobasidium subglaciale EXF-2481]